MCVTIGILIYVTYKIEEVNIGKIENISHVKKNGENEKMSTEIISAVKKN